MSDEIVYNGDSYEAAADVDTNEDGFLINQPQNTEGVRRQKWLSFIGLRAWISYFFTRSVGSIAELESLTGTKDGQTVKLKGYYSGTPLEMPDYVVKVSSTKTPNGGSVIARAEGGRYEWKEVPVINVKQFGAVGDGDKTTHTGTDDTDSFKNAINYARNFNTYIYAPRCDAEKGYILNDTLFFGPLTLADITAFPATNICAGLVGDTDEATNIICGDGLADKVVLDYTGMGHKIAKDFTIWRNIEVNAPSIGILTGRFKNTGTGGVTGNYGGQFKDITMYKYFTIAGRLAITTEETREERLNIRNDHTDSFSCFVSTSDASSEAYNDGTSYSWLDLIGQVADPQCQLTREDVAGSNLHQTHIKCDYYYGNNSPDPNKNPCMLRIDGANGMRIVDAFFNNNFINHDAVQIRKAGVGGVPYGITIENPLYHQQIKSGVRIMTGLNRFNHVTSNTLPGFAFDEAEIVIDGFLSGATIDSVDSIIQNEQTELCVFSYISGEYQQNALLIATEIESANEYTQGSGAGITSSKITAKTFTWNSDVSIISSEVNVRNTLNIIGSRGGDPSFNLKYESNSFNVNGQIPSSWLGSPATLPSDSLNYSTSNLKTLNTVLNRSVGIDSQVLEHENAGFNATMQNLKGPSGSTADFNYRQLSRGGTPEVTEKKGGIVIYELNSGGVVLTSPGGTKYRLVVDNSGVLSTVVYT